MQNRGPENKRETKETLLVQSFISLNIVYSMFFMFYYFLSISYEFKSLPLIGLSSCEFSDVD